MKTSAVEPEPSRSAVQRPPDRVSGDDRLMNIVAAFALALTDKVNAAIKEAGGHNPTTAAALIQIGFNSSLSIDRLRSIIGLSHSAAVRVIDQLQKEGLVERARLLKHEQGDSRVAHLVLTGTGRAEMERILSARRRIATPVFAGLDGSQRAALTALVERILPEVISSRADEDTTCRLCDERICPQDRCPAIYCQQPPQDGPC